MSPIQALAAWSATHHGVVTLDRLVRLGFTARNVDTQIRLGVLRRACRAVYVVAAVPPTVLQAYAVAVAATGGAISHTSAGSLAAFRGLPRDGSVHVTIAHHRSLDLSALPAHVVLHRTRALPRTDLVRRGDGIVVTSSQRTAFDLAAVLDADALESLIEQGIDRGMFTVPTLWAAARRLARPGRDGSGRFVDVLASRPAWVKPVGSHDELVLVGALVALGVPAPVRQHPIELARGRDVHPDLAWPDLRLAIEVDHVSWHGGRLDSTYDKWRDRQLRLRGWEVDRVTDTDLRDHRAATVRDVRALYDRRAADLARRATA